MPSIPRVVRLKSPASLPGRGALIASLALAAYVALVSVALAGTPPSNTVAPSITGDTEVGSTLTASPGTWTGDPTITYGYQWQRCEGSGTEVGADWLALTSSATETGRWRSVAWGGPDGDKKFVAVANANATGSPFAADQLVITSPDGVTWTRQTALAGNWWDVTWGDPSGPTPGQFVAVARSASGNQIMTSPDGITWTQRTAPNSEQWTSVTWGNNKFVAVALTYSGGKQVMTSPDGITWTEQDAASTNTWINVTYGGPSGQEKFVAVGDSGSNPNYTAQIMTSPDGINWTSRSSSFATITESVEWGNGKFVASGSFNSKVLTSSDGITWADAGATGYSPGLMSFGGPPGEEEFLALEFSFSGTATNTLTSPDGVTWTEHPDALPKDVWYWPFWGGPAGEEKWVAPGLSLFSNTKPLAISPGLICTDITGADDPTYQLTGDDKGKKIRVKVTGTNGSGSSTANSDVTAEVTATPPANTDPPSISGDPKVGSTLTGDPGTWTGAPPPDLTYQWQRCSEEVSSNILGTTGVFPAYLALDSTGNVYTVNNTAQNVSKITQAGSSSVLGTTGSNPYSIVLDSSGNAYVTNNSSNNVTKITPGGSSSVLASVGTNPVGIAIDASGNIYTANFGSNNVTKITPGGSASTLGTTGTNPYGITVDSAGNVYTTNFGSDNVTKITPGGSSSTLGTTGSDPVGLVLDPAGNVYTANYSNGTAGSVTKITSGGSSSTFATTGNGPYGIARDSAGNLYTANIIPDNVTKITPAGVPSIYANTGTDPRAIVVDSEDSVYTANAGSDNVSKIGPTCEDISGAINPTYEPTAGDVGKTLRVKVTGSNSEGSTVAISDRTGVVQSGPTPPGPDKPTVKPDGAAGPSFMRLKVRCAGSKACTVKITGKLKGGKGKVKPKTVRVKAGKQIVVKVEYTSALKTELRSKGGGKIRISARQVGGATRTITVRVKLPKPVTG